MAEEKKGFFKKLGDKLSNKDEIEAAEALKNVDNVAGEAAEVEAKAANLAKSNADEVAADTALTTGKTAADDAEAAAQEAAWQIERLLRDNGSETIPFEIIVASGPRSALPHARPTERIIRAGEPIIIDMGAKVEGYCSDLSRTICLGPGRDPMFSKIYGIVYKAQAAAIEGIRAGMSSKQADNLARSVIEQYGYGTAFGHSLGHGIGLAPHESPSVSPASDSILSDTMVFTIEPGIYLKEWGGVRIEDTTVMENGKVFGEEYTLVAAADYVLQHSKGNTVSNLSSSRALRDITEKYGGKYYASAVGEVNVVEKMKEVNAVIGGEGNGGVIYPELHSGRDALVGIALILTYMAKKQISLSELKKTYPSYSISKNKIKLKNTDELDGLFDHIKNRYASYPVSTIDGVKIDFADGWVHLRPSNTKPIIRVYAESTDEKKAESYANDIIRLANEFMN